MNKSFLFIFCFIFCLSFSQNDNEIKVKGVILDKNTSESLPLANIVFQNLNGKMITGVTANENGEFEVFLNSDEKNCKLIVSYIGYNNFQKTLELSKNIEITIKMDTEELNVVNIISDQAEFRKTPVSLSNVKLEKIESELAGQEIPMLLNSTPGVYATQQGGGDGDVRINIRGFSQRNVAVMIDGVPMNDMENGQVYWSNWFGLDGLTRTIQVQRGLGASKLALPSVGGTINIITKGVNNPEGGMIKQEIGSGNSLRTYFAYTSKDLKIGKFNIAGAFKRSDGVINQTPSEGLFYYIKWQKQFKNHIFSLSGFGAPQEHAQRKYQTGMTEWDASFASDLGVDTNLVNTGDYGLTYNPNWGVYNNYNVIFDEDPNSPTFSLPLDTIWGENIYLNKQKNYYHKPVYTFQHLWNINEKSTLSNVFYYSKGNGGGTDIEGGFGPSYYTNEFTNNFQIDFQKIYNSNNGNTWIYWQNEFGPSIDTLYSFSEKKSTTILRSSINNHYWGGFLSTFDHKINKNFDLSAGLDFRTYKGEHYREVYDLIGGDYYGGSDVVQGTEAPDNFIGFNSNNLMLREGDKIKYHNDGFVRWAGAFGQIEYNYKDISAFINITGSQSFYKRIDYFKRKDIVLEDTILIQAVGINETVTYNGNEYNTDSPEARFSETEWQTFPGFTFKAGANWNINESNNIFLNTGFLSKAPKFNYIFNYDNGINYDIKNEIIQALEIGYGYRSENFLLHINLYNTIWKNKPQTGTTSLDEAGTERVYYNINGINALHQGIELDFAWKISKYLTYEFLSSIGNWRWNSGDTIDFYLNQELLASDYFDASGVYVGDSPQTQIGSSIAYNINLSKNSSSYIKLKGMYSDRFFSDFDPYDLRDGNKNVWKMPGYALFSLHLGNNLYFKKSSVHLKLNVLNLFNTTYLSDAQNNSDYTGVTNNNLVGNNDATSASVFFGLPRRIVASIEYKF